MTQDHPIKSKEQIMAELQSRNERKESSPDYNQSSSGDKIRYPTAKWTPIKENAYTIFHPVGKLMEQRTENWEAKLIVTSNIVDDNGNTFKVCYPYLTDEYNSPKINDYNQAVLDPDYILYRMWALLREGMTFKEATKTAKPVTGEYANTEAYKRIFWNKTPQEMGNSYNKPWLGEGRVILPGWDPLDDWCAKNNHTKLLTTKVNVYTSKKTGQPVEDAQRGVTYGIYNKFLAQVALYNEGSLDTDIILKKHPNAKLLDMYEILSSSDARIVKMVEAETGIKINSQPLDSDFVNKLKHHNLDDPLMFLNPTSNFQIKKRLGKLVQLVDQTVNEHKGNSDCQLFEELSERAAQEEAEFKKQMAAKSNTIAPVIRSESPVRASSPIQENKKELDTETRCANLYPYWNKLSPEEKKLHVDGITGWNETGYPLFQKDDKDNYPACGDCRFPSGDQVITHLSVQICPQCGKVFSPVEDSSPIGEEDIPF